MTRFATILSCLRPDHILYDLCCDHGRIGLEALPQAKKVCFVDQSEEALRALREAIPLLPAEEQRKTEVICSSAEALSLPDEASDVIIAGVGIQTTIAIIAALVPDDLRNHRLILAPQQASEALREYLRKRGWGLIAERVVEERGRFREVIVIEKSGKEVSAYGESFADQDDPVARRFAKHSARYYERLRSLRGR